MHFRISSFNPSRAGEFSFLAGQKLELLSFFLELEELKEEGFLLISIG